MKIFFKKLTSFMFPWAVLLFNDNPSGALIALVMQLSIIGWIPASQWATRVWLEGEKKEEKLKIDD